MTNSLNVTKTYDLMLKVKEILENNGFEVESTKSSNLKDFEYQGYATKDGKSWREPVKGYSFTHLEGYRITFEVVHRHNGADENISVDIALYKWHQSCGQRMARERVNINMSEKSIVNRVNKIVTLYNDLKVER